MDSRSQKLFALLFAVLLVCTPIISAGAQAGNVEGIKWPCDNCATDLTSLWDGSVGAQYLLNSGGSCANAVAAYKRDLDDQDIPQTPGTCLTHNCFTGNCISVSTGHEGHRCGMDLHSTHSLSKIVDCAIMAK